MCCAATCPSDCSGHGLCRSVADIAASASNAKLRQSVAGINEFSGVTEPFRYSLWDADKNHACVCDAGYGGVDCSLRECPRGDDPLTHTADTCGDRTCTNEVQGFSVDGGQAWPGKTYRLVFTDYAGKKYRTEEFRLVSNADAEKNSTLGDFVTKAVKTALEALPNRVAGIVKVTATGGGASAEKRLRLLVTFSTLSGNVPDMRLTWADTTDPGASVYVVQPWQVIQTFTLKSVVPATTPNVDIRVFPRDAANATLDKYFVGTLSNWDLDASTNTDWYKDLQDAINDIPYVKAAYSNGGVRVEAAGDPTAADGTTVSMIFADKNIGGTPLSLSSTDLLPTGTAFWITKDAGDTAGIIPEPDTADGNTEAALCSNRGLCDFASGTCACFTGYTGAACNQQNVLSM